MHLNNFIDELKIKKGDTLLITGNTIKLLKKFKRTQKEFSLNHFIDKVIQKLGEEGTLIFQTFNWGFCRNEPFDILNTRSQTGAIGNIALKRDDFIRTKHPIYSFAVTGKYKNELANLHNIGAFDINSPFAFMHEKKASMIIIDLDLQNSFTFGHYVEELRNISYRYNKHFTSKYIDIDGHEEMKTYDMYVRDIEHNVQTSIHALEDLFVEQNAMITYNIDGIQIRNIDLNTAFTIVDNDIIYNDAKNLYIIEDS